MLSFYTSRTGIWIIIYIFRQQRHYDDESKNWVIKRNHQLWYTSHVYILYVGNRIESTNYITTLKVQHNNAQ